jgi:hypothetical protein
MIVYPALKGGRTTRGATMATTTVQRGGTGEAIFSQATAGRVLAFFAKLQVAAARGR